MIVVAAVIERAGRILVCQRKRGARHELKWEFPGGKVEPNEEPRAALARELREELEIDAQIGAEIVRYEHSYPGRDPILLIFYRVAQYERSPVNVVFETIEWTDMMELPKYDFLDGDIDFVRRLARGEYAN
ncbi:MAG TPA: (deoxy)nucleoside triphosphate pyrophosphohydrolase [Bryobacteraceae bacterium]